MPTLVLASASPARLATLRSAGIEPQVVVSHVDEDAVLGAARAAGPVTPADAVLLLARAKAQDVAARLRAAATGAAPAAATGADERVATGDVLVLGCDSMLELDGEVLGKPGTPDVARERWHAMRGRTGVLHSGHWLVDLRPATDATGPSDTPGPSDAPEPPAVGATSSTRVTFADVTDAEVDAYVATGEPLAVAGAFTIDGLGGPFVERIEGDHHGVVGVSLPLLRHLAAQHGVAWPTLWSAGPL